MQAQETQIRVLLEGQKQFSVPLFQRTYSWGPHQWKALWQDLTSVMESGRHFLGSIVSKDQGANPANVSRFMLIDGQQRLITLSILLNALAHAYRGIEPGAAERLTNVYLVNPYASKELRQKLIPTPADRNVYSAILDGDRDVSGADGISEAYRFFQSRLAPESIDLANVEAAALHRLEIVSITLSEDDNEYRIFESLNAKGLPLSQADLIRNYFFMRLPEDQQESMYQKTWRPMEDTVGVDRLGTFYRYDYMLSGEFVRDRDVYQAWKRRLEPLTSDELSGEIHRLAVDSEYFVKLIRPETEQHPAVRRGIERLNRWGGQTMYPLVLWLYRERNEGCIVPDEMSVILTLIESFLVRRMFASVPTNQLNRLFIRLAHQLPEEGSISGAVRRALSEPSRRWPNDGAFRKGILQYPLYTDSRPDQRRLILETFEESYGHKEPVVLRRLTVEHVMPQELTTEWKDELGSGAAQTHSELVHTLGNLTLTGYNPELSNRPWNEKKDLLRNSHLAMNWEMAENLHWSREEILARGNRMADKAVDLWPGPTVSA